LLKQYITSYQTVVCNILSRTGRPGSKIEDVSSLVGSPYAAPLNRQLPLLGQNRKGKKEKWRNKKTSKPNTIFEWLQASSAVKWDLLSFGMLRSVVWWLCTDVSGQPIGHIFKGKSVRVRIVEWVQAPESPKKEFLLDSFTLEYETDMLSRNVGK
jgi:hypothetical protein